MKWIVSFFVTVGVLVAAFFTGRKSGKEEAENDQHERNAEADKHVQEAVNRVDNLDDDAIDAELRKHTRD